MVSGHGRGAKFRPAWTSEIPSVCLKLKVRASHIEDGGDSHATLFLHPGALNGAGLDGTWLGVLMDPGVFSFMQRGSCSTHLQRASLNQSASPFKQAGKQEIKHASTQSQASKSTQTHKQASKSTQTHTSKQVHTNTQSNPFEHIFSILRPDRPISVMAQVGIGLAWCFCCRKADAGLNASCFESRGSVVCKA